MSFLPALPDDAKLYHVFDAYPEAGRALMAYHDVVMLATSPFSQAERELMAAHVSQLNACAYCAGLHGAIAERLGVDPALLDALANDPAGAPVDAKLRPVLDYIAKLTRTPERMVPGDAAAILEAGWPEAAIHAAASVAAIYNALNRLVAGLGIEANQAYFDLAAERMIAEAAAKGMGAAK